MVSNPPEAPLPPLHVHCFVEQTRSRLLVGEIDSNFSAEHSPQSRHAELLDICPQSKRRISDHHGGAIRT